MTAPNLDKVADERIGQTIDSRYVILEKIAHGGMATVYKAIDRRLDRVVALKLMHPHLANGPEGATFVSRFRREARAAARLNHQGIVAVYDQGVDNSISYLTMEFVEGTNLRRRLKSVGTFSIGDALKNMESILRALAAAHRAGLVHRDVKPENVLINKRGQLQLTDFGLARIATEMSTSTTGTVFGTVAYLAPEIIETGYSDARSDIYSVGVMLYELIAGKQPYAGTTPIQIAFKHVNEDVPVLSDLHPEVPRSVALLIEVFSARDMNKRPPDAAKALELLTKLGRSLSSSDLAAKLPRPESDDLADEQVNMAAVAAGGSANSDPDVVGALDFSTGGVESKVPEAESAFDDYSGTNAGAPAVDTGAVTEYIERVDSPDDVSTDFLTGSQIKTVQNSSHGLNSSLDNSSLGLDADSADQVDENTGHKQKRVKKGLIIAIATLLVILIGVFFWWYQAMGPGSFVSVPYGITGIPASNAQQKLEDVGIKSTTEEVYSDVVEAGKVISSDPESGSSISKNGKGVKLVVSKGIQLIDIPGGIVGTPLDTASAALTKAGFDTPKVVREFNKTVAKDVVISVDPPEGTAAVKHNATLTLKVSDGPKPSSLPNVQGIPLTDAAAILEEYGISYAEVDVYSDDVAEGYVISQGTAAGAVVYEGDNITLTVSKGSETVSVPDVVKLPAEEAKKAIAAAGLEVVVTGESVLGVVQKQDVAAGTKVKRGSRVTITVV